MAISSSVEKEAVPATCSAVIESIGGPPDFFAAFVEATIRLISDRNEVKSGVRSSEMLTKAGQTALGEGE